jgi:FAD dependent oxidoreductase TIGR03364
MANIKYDLAIIGGGILGTFAAYHAAQAGKKVLILERSNVPVSASVQNFGQIVPSGLKGDWRKYGAKTVEVLTTLQSKGDFGVRQNGSIYLASDEYESTLIQEMAKINSEEEYDHKLMEKDEAIRQFPYINENYCHSAIYYPQEISTNPSFLLEKVHKYLTEVLEVSIQYYTAVKDVQTIESQCYLATTNGKIFSSDKVLVCTGAEYQTLFPEFYYNDEIECSKIQMLFTKPTSVKLNANVLSGLSIRRYESFKECPSYHNYQKPYEIDEQAKEWGIHILFKQDVDGRIIIGDSHEYQDAHKKDLLGFRVQHDVNNYIIELAKKMIHLDNWEIDTSWYGIYPQCKNHDIYEATIDDNIHIVNAIGGKGMTASPGYMFYYIQKLYNL